MATLIMTDSQQSELSVRFLNPAGEPTGVDGLPRWSTSDPAIVALTVAEDGMSALAVSGTPGTAVVTVVADADLSEGVRDISGTLDVQIIATPPPEAVTVEISFSEPVPKL